MCGIVGFIDFARRQSPDAMRAILAKMMKAVTHRGPDDEGDWVDADCGVALGQTRLAIVDLSPTGRQPMFSADGRYVMVYNGELYNTAELRAELEARQVAFRGHSDSEVLLEACAAWGVARALERLNGMFAFALWDRQQQCLHLVRDGVGIKPLYWAVSPRGILFGSELTPLRRHPDFDPEIDRDAVVSLLGNAYVKGPRSIYRKARKLAPGHLLTVHQDGRQVMERYRDAGAELLDSPQNAAADESQLDRLERVLSDAVRRQMVADVPLGAFLSGGIDSSLLTALMQRQSNTPVSSFTIGFHEAGFNEAEHAKAIAAYLGTQHHELYVDPAQCRDVIPDLPRIYDEPFADVSQIPTVLLARMTRREVKVAISGDGGDELFAGYDRYRWTLQALRVRRRMPAWARRCAAAALRAPAPGTWNRLAGRLPGRSPADRLGEKLHRAARMLRGPTLACAYNVTLAQWEDPRSGVVNGADYAGYADPATLLPAAPGALAFMQYLDFSTYLPDDILTKVDRATMAASLEARVPFLDDQVLKAAATLPAALRIDGDQGKVALQRLLRRHLPERLVERPKQGFSVPIGQWLRGPLRDWAEELLSERVITQHGLLDPAAVRQLWREHLSGQVNRQYQLWGPLMLQAWLQSGDAA